MSDKFFVGLDITGFEDTGKYKPVSRVTLLADGDNVFTAGDDTGLAIEADCPHATQAMVDEVLANIRGYQYQAYTADAANIDPAAELGDGINVGGIYSSISRIDDDGEGYPSMSAPGEAELEDEYPTAGPMTKHFNQQLAYTRSLITKTADQINLTVERVDGLDEAYTKLSVGLDGVLIEDETTGQTMIEGGRIKTDSLVLTGSITWEDLDSNVQNDINDRGISASRCRTIINEELVASPNIAGGKFWNLNMNTWIELGKAVDDVRDDNYALMVFVPGDSLWGIYKGDFGYISLMGPGSTTYMRLQGVSGGEATATPVGMWDFSGATVEGLYLAYAPD